MGDLPGGTDDTYRELHRSLRHRLRGLALADGEYDELYQEAWLEVVKRSNAGQAIHDLRAFLLGVMVNRWRMEARRRHRNPAGPLHDRANEVEDRAAPVSYRVITREEARRGIAAITRLRDPRRRRVLELRLVAEMSPAEIQQAMGISERTYRRLLTEAMRDINVQLGGDGGGSGR